MVISDICEKRTAEQTLSLVAYQWLSSKAKNLLTASNLLVTLSLMLCEHLLAAVLTAANLRSGVNLLAALVRQLQDRTDHDTLHTGLTPQAEA